MTLTIHRDAGRILARGDGRDLAVLSRSPHGLRVVGYLSNRPLVSKALEQAIIAAFHAWEKTS